MLKLQQLSFLEVLESTIFSMMSSKNASLTSIPSMSFLMMYIILFPFLSKNFLQDIRTAIRNANGLRPSLFIPEMAFEILIKQQISRLQEPALECSHLVYEELRKILFHINIPDISRFEVLNSKIYEVIS